MRSVCCSPVTRFRAKRGKRMKRPSANVYLPRYQRATIPDIGRGYPGSISLEQRTLIPDDRSQHRHSTLIAHAALTSHTRARPSVGAGWGPQETIG